MAFASVLMNQRRSSNRDAAAADIPANNTTATRIRIPEKVMDSFLHFP